MDLLEQLAQIDRLHQIVVVKALSLDEVALIDGIRRQYDHRGAFARGPPQAPRDLPAVHLGHGDVEQDQVRLVLLGEDQAFPPGRCDQDIESERGQQLPDQVALNLVVVHHENGLPRPDIAAHAVLHGRGDARARHLGQQQFDAKAAAFADLALHRQVAAHHVGEELRDGQAQPRPYRRLGARRARTLERLEDALQVALVNADAGILDREFGDLVAVVDAEGDVTGIRVLDRIREQVDQDLPQPVLVGAHHGGQVFRRGVAELDALGRRLQAEHVDELIEEVAGVHLVAAEVETPGFDLRYVEQPVDQPGKVLGAAAHDLDGVDAAGRQRGIALQQLRIAEDGVERGAQFMAQPDDMPAFRLARRFGDLLGLLQLGVGALVRLDLVHQQVGLPARLLLGDAAAVLRQHEQPGGDAGDDGQDEEHRPQGRLQHFLWNVGIERDLEINEREHRADHAAEQQQHAEVAADVGIERPDDPVRENPVEQG